MKSLEILYWSTGSTPAAVAFQPAKSKLRRLAKADSAIVFAKAPAGRPAVLDVMKYVYLIQSRTYPIQRYIGRTSDLKKRITAHNEGRSPHTSKYKPWKLVTYIAFFRDSKAAEFEKYLKSGSGRAFAQKRLWQPKGKFGQPFLPRARSWLKCTARGLTGTVRGCR